MNDSRNVTLVLGTFCKLASSVTQSLQDEESGSRFGSRRYSTYVSLLYQPNNYVFMSFVALDHNEMMGPDVGTDV